MASIDHVHIHASDPAKTIEFYKSFFGAEVIQTIESVGRKLTIMSLGDKSKLSILHVPPAVEKPNPDMASIDHIGIEVENIEELINRLKENGFSFSVDLTQSASGVKIAFFFGPDNVYIELIERP
jgi:catechol 2,3-dioxygenase-like lactoylglutathione lyase family enzyme